MTNQSNKDLNIDFPLNNLSFGQVSVAILREMYKRGMTPNIFPLQGQVDIGSQVPDECFNQWLGHCINKAPREYSRKARTTKLWHINGSFSSYSEEGNDLIVFHELDSLTSAEINVLKNQRKVYVTSTYTQQIFKMFGIESTYLPLGFDSHNFKMLEKRSKIEGVTSWGVFGKLEPLRKSHAQIIRNWVKKYGNNRNHRLNLAVANPFLNESQFNGLLGQILEGKNYFNVNLIPHQQANAAYNQVLQASEIVLCMGVGEGRDLPCYHATAMGAWPVAMNCSAYPDYLNSENAILVNPNGKQVAHDGMFFNHSSNNPWNQGNLFTFSDDDFIAAMERAEKRVANSLNTAGMELQKITYRETLDALTK